MEPLSTATALATVIGLLADFKSLRKEAGNDQYAEFLEWLSETRHTELLEEIKTNQRLSIGIKVAVNESTDEFKTRLDRIDTVLAQIASGLGIFSELAVALKPNIEISSQASSIIKQLVDSGAEKFMWIKVMSDEPDQLILVGGNKGRIDYEEPRFLKDDLETITDLGLVRLTYGSKGTENYHVTRGAVEYAKTL